MDTLRKQVARARRRLILGRLFAALAWSWTGSFFVAAIAIAVSKVWPLGIDGWAWSAGWIGGAVFAGLLFAGLWTWLHLDGPLAAAMEIDHRFGLKERVSSALALPPAELQSEVGQALVNDAVRRVERIDVGSRFNVPLGRRNLIPLLPAMLVFGLTFVADRGTEPQADAAIQPPNSQQLQQSAEALRKKLAERQKEAAEQGLKEGDLFKKIEQGLKDLAKKDGLDQKQALVKLNDFAKELEARHEKLGGDDKLKQQLGQMKDLKNGPAEKLADALKNGDFQKAIKELDNLKDELNNDKLDPEKQKQLAEQLDAMRKNLEKMVEKHEQAKKELERQIQQMTAVGKTAEAQKLQQQLDKLQQQSSQMNQLKQLAGQCKQCAGALQSGKAGAAKNALDQLRGQLSDLKQQSDELAMLDLTLDQISDCKAGMCKCEGQGNCNSDSDQFVGERQGGGKARASGHRPEQATDTKFYDSNVKQKMTKGAAVSVGEAGGPNIKGQVQEEIKAQIESAKHDSADPLTGQRLPRSQREHAKEYFDALREGK
ncbi:MAG TPA: hypothetical protein VG056_12535 [Pirellulales bacterium]|nr:hypothetical protein [Pirellulales bacterium]